MSTYRCRSSAPPIAGKPERLYRRHACRCVRSDCARFGAERLSPNYHGVATSRSTIPGSGRDRRPRCARRSCRHAGIGRTVLPAGALVGVDNPAAGRTAASLMGRFLGGRKGKVGVIVARCRCAIMQNGIRILSGSVRRISNLGGAAGARGARQQRTESRADLGHARRTLRSDWPLQCSAGNEGIAGALEASGRAQDIVWIAHELTADTRRFLLGGVATRSSIRIRARSPLRGQNPACHCLGESINPDQERIRIEIFLRTICA